jgi:microcompartment protein CcmL/EutN
MSVFSLGLIETRGLVAAIEAADAAAKAANVTLLSAELLGGGIVTLRMQGELGAVQAAVEAGAQAAKRIGEVIAVRVIPRPVPELASLAPARKFQSRTPDLKQATTAESVSAKTVTSEKTPGKARPELAPPKSNQTRGQIAPKLVHTEIAKPAIITPTTVHPAPSAPTRPHYDFAELEAMSVVRLRQFARSVKNLGIQGRQISMANKTQLLEAIRQAVSAS